VDDSIYLGFRKNKYKFVLYTASRDTVLSGNIVSRNSTVQCWTLWTRNINVYWIFSLEKIVKSRSVHTFSMGHCRHLLSVPPGCRVPGGDCMRLCYASDRLRCLQIRLQLWCFVINVEAVWTDCSYSREWRIPFSLAHLRGSYNNDSILISPTLGCLKYSILLNSPLGPVDSILL
jgi:hypothetical protein